MFHNIKADIIYYKTTTDFELEFNLCGCCRMRLLSDKMQDKKSFVHSLARAVSRSSVILIAGPLFGENGTIETVTEAINSTTELVDNSAYGISGDYEIKIIKDSIPLVTPEGYFGGCIIESGPQTMILLTDNKDIRKTIMKNLIHPYIEELYSAQVNQLETSKQPEVEEDSVIIDEESPEIPEPLPEISNDDVPSQITEAESSDQDEEQAEETEVINEDSAKESENESSVDESSTEQSEDYEDSIDLFLEPTKLDRETVGKYTQEYNIQEDDYNYQEDSFYEERKPKRKIGFSLAVFIISIILLLVIVVLCYCIFIAPTKQGVSPVANLQEIFNTMFG